MKGLLQAVVPYLPTIALLAIPAVGAWIGKTLKTPSEMERAQLLAHIAGDVAQFIRVTYPNAAWPEKLKLVIATLSQTAGIPTKNARVLERVAINALASQGEPNPGARAPSPTQ